MAINYSREGDKVEIIIRDNTGAKLDHFTCNMKDKKKYSAILKYLKEKYNFEPEVESSGAKAEDVDWWE